MRHKEIRLLLVEDDPDDATFLLEELRISSVYSFHVDWVDRRDAALTALEANRYDVVLTDLNLPESTGVGTLLSLRRAFPEVPIIVLSGNDDAATAILALKAGAQDYLIKHEVDRRRVSRSIAFALERARIEAQLLHRTEELAGFTYAVTHDLRTPLLSIDYLLEEVRELIAGHDLPADVPTHLDAISARIGNMEALISDLLVLARAAEGPQDDVVDVARLVADVLADLAPRIDAHGIDVRIDVDDMPPVRANDTQMRQLMANLVGNAVKYTRENGGQVTIRALPLGAHGTPSAYRIEVGDNGPGVPAADRDRVFQAFVRLDDPLGRRIGGSGIGLAIASKVAHNLGSRIHIRDAPDGGAVFYLDLPAQRILASDVRSAARAESGWTETGVH